MLFALFGLALKGEHQLTPGVGDQRHVHSWNPVLVCPLARPNGVLQLKISAKQVSLSCSCIKTCFMFLAWSHSSVSFCYCVIVLAGLVPDLEQWRPQDIREEQQVQGRPGLLPSSGELLHNML
jgi:hypothetical protein